MYLEAAKDYRKKTSATQLPHVLALEKQTATEQLGSERKHDETRQGKTRQLRERHDKRVARETTSQGKRFARQTREESRERATLDTSLIHNMTAHGHGYAWLQHVARDGDRESDQKGRLMARCVRACVSVGMLLAPSPSSSCFLTNSCLLSTFPSP